MNQVTFLIEFPNSIYHEFYIQILNAKYDKYLDQSLANSFFATNPFSPSLIETPYIFLYLPYLCMYIYFFPFPVYKHL